MRNEFQILAGFLERFDDEVEGRSLEEPTQAMKTKLSAFAKGTLPESERGEVLVALNKNPQWMSQVASEVKALRDSSANKG